MQSLTKEQQEQVFKAQAKAQQEVGMMIGATIEVVKQKFPKEFKEEFLRIAKQIQQHSQVTK